MTAAGTAVLLVGHGTVDDLDDLPAFLAAIRRGHPPPPDLAAEIRRRYEAIGGKSPLLSISQELANKLEARLGRPVRLAMRLWRPYPKEVLASLAELGVRRVVVVALAQHSAHVYTEAVKKAAAELAASGGPELEIDGAPNWGRSAALTRAFARAVLDAIADLGRPAADRALLLLFTAHSLPLSVIRGGDPYEGEVRASAADVAAALGEACPAHALAFQSQGLGAGEWLGPDLVTSLDRAKAEGRSHVLVAPIGFLADHVEILYDLDIEAAALAKERGLTLSRTRSLNASDGLVDALAEVARGLL